MSALATELVTSSYVARYLFISTALCVF